MPLSVTFYALLLFNIINNVAGIVLLNRDEISLNFLVITNFIAFFLAIFLVGLSHYLLKLANQRIQEIKGIYSKNEIEKNVSTK